SYGAFASAGGQGTFSITVTWSSVQSIANGANARPLLVTFFDNAGNRVTAPFTLTLACKSASDTVCDGKCVNLMTDPSNCGACGNVIPEGGPGVTCVNGMVDCAVSTGTLCNNFCVHTSSDLYNCGACNHSCYAWADAHGIDVGGFGHLTCLMGTCEWTT